jgi:hypothetical protein
MHTFEDVEVRCHDDNTTGINLYNLLRKALSTVFIKRFKLDNYLEKWHVLSNGGKTVSCVRKNDLVDEYMFIFCETDFSKVLHVEYKFVIDNLSNGAWVAVGAGIERINLQTRPHWEYRDKHLCGAYTIASNKYLSVHGNSDKNNSHTGFHFSTGEVIYVTYNGINKTLEFKLKGNRVITMTNVLPEARPCIISWGGELSVTIK